MHVSVARAFAEKVDTDWCQFTNFIFRSDSSLCEEIMQKGLYDRVEDFVTYVKTEDFDYESVLEVQRRFHMSFDRSPKRILRKIRREDLFAVLRKSHSFCR